MRNFLRSGIVIPEAQKNDLKLLLQKTFSLDESSLLYNLVVGVNRNYSDKIEYIDLEIERRDKELLDLFPSSGWFADYFRFSANSEVPFAYHVFCSLLLVGASFGRRIWLDMGYFQIFPPMGVILLGPSGVKKTTAIDIATDICIRSNLTGIYAEKITPEALALSMSQTHAQGIIYAPEATVLLGKQKYNEGLIPFLTRLMDCPRSITPTTILRGAIEIKDVAISIIAGSTTDWFVENTPRDMFGGGFIARHILIHQQMTNKSFPFPSIDQANAPLLLGRDLLRKRSLLNGSLSLSPLARDFYISWYHENKKLVEHPPYQILVSYLKRKPIHVLRTAINLHVMICESKEICETCLFKATKILLWNEQFLSPMLEELFKTPEGRDHDYVKAQLASEKGGISTHTNLVRKVQHRMTAQRLKHILHSLKEAKQVEESHDSLSHYWRLI